MNEHPSPSELQSFRQRQLPPAAMLRVDRHIAGCEPCRAQCAAAISGAGGAQAALQAVVAAGAHLSYEQIESLVNARLAPDQQHSAQAHLTHCAMCRREVADLRAQAPALRQPLRATTAATARGSWWASLIRLGPALALASVVGAVGLTVVLQQTRPGGSGGAPEAMHTAPPGSEAQRAFDHSALDQLESVSAEAAAAWRQKDHARLLALLVPLTERSQPLALAALASLYAQGLGVTQDWRMAEQLWQRAASLGHAGAAQNLKALRQDKG